MESKGSRILHRTLSESRTRRIRGRLLRRQRQLVSAHPKESFLYHCCTLIPICPSSIANSLAPQGRNSTFLRLGCNSSGYCAATFLYTSSISLVTSRYSGCSFSEYTESSKSMMLKPSLFTTQKGVGEFNSSWPMVNSRHSTKVFRPTLMSL